MEWVRAWFRGDVDVLPPAPPIPNEKDEAFELTRVQAWARLVNLPAFGCWMLFVGSIAIGRPFWPLGVVSFAIYAGSFTLLNRAAFLWRYGRRSRWWHAGDGWRHNTAFREFNRRFTWQDSWSRLRERRNPPGPVSR